MGMDTPSFTPHSSGFDTSSIPFVFSDGVLSFYSPTADAPSSDFGPSTSPIASSVNSTSFLEVLPDSPRSGISHPTLQKLAIWRHNDGAEDHVYAEASCGTSSRVRETMSLVDLDPLLDRYGAVHASLTQISTIPCPVMHVFVRLNPFSPTTAEDPHVIDSIITISTPSRSPVRLVCTVYSQGTLAFSNETDLVEEPSLHFSDAQYSAALPQQLVDELCKDVGGPDSREGGMLDSIAVMLFMQHTDLEDRGDEKVILVLVCDFKEHQGQGPEFNQAGFSQLSAGTILSQDLFMRMSTLPSSSPSCEDLSDVKHAALQSIQSSKRTSRVIPKLSVAIPPPPHGRGLIQLYTDSPGSTPAPAEIHSPPTPQTGVPENVFPLTPFVATPPHPPEMQLSKVCSRAGHPAESAYPFILTTASPRTAQSPAFGLLDSARHEESGPPWPHPSRSCVPSPSPPHSTSSQWPRF